MITITMLFNLMGKGMKAILLKYDEKETQLTKVDSVMTKIYPQLK